MPRSGNEFDDVVLPGMAVGEPDFEAVVRVGDTLLALLQAERNKGINDGCTVPEGCRHHCPLCPVRVLLASRSMFESITHRKAILL